MKIDQEYDYYKINEGSELNQSAEDYLLDLEQYKGEKAGRLTALMSAIGANKLYGNETYIKGAGFSGDAPDHFRWDGNCYVPRTRTPEGKAVADLMNRVFEGLKEPSLKEVLGSSDEKMSLQTRGISLWLNWKSESIVNTSTGIVVVTPRKENSNRWGDQVTKLTYDEVDKLTA